jgi:hypothetical protein
MNRYQRVKEILAVAAAGSQADYGGLGPFWNLPLDQLLHATLYDVRLIAPAEEAPKRCQHPEIGWFPTTAAKTALVENGPACSGSTPPLSESPTFRSRSDVGVSSMGTDFQRSPWWYLKLVS